MNAEDWRNQAACRNDEPELWYCRDGDYETRKIAVSICEGCPVKEQCLTVGMTEEFGIWGGLTGRQRRQIRRNRRATPALGTERRLRALARRGWGAGDIASMVNRANGSVSLANLRRITAGNAVGIHVDTAQCIARAYDALIRNGTPTSIGARRRILAAEFHGWPRPEDWAGLDMDDPAAQPRSAVDIAA